MKGRGYVRALDSVLAEDRPLQDGEHDPWTMREPMWARHARIECSCGRIVARVWIGFRWIETDPEPPNLPVWCRWERERAMRRVRAHVRRAAQTLNPWGPRVNDEE